MFITTHNNTDPDTRHMKYGIDGYFISRDVAQSCAKRLCKETQNPVYIVRDGVIIDTYMWDSDESKAILVIT